MYPLRQGARALERKRAGRTRPGLGIAVAAALLARADKVTRMTFSIRVKVPGPIVWLLKFTYRYSAFTDQFGNIAS
jgi:hypothetical protein